MYAYFYFIIRELNRDYLFCKCICTPTTENFLFENSVVSLIMGQVPGWHHLTLGVTHIESRHATAPVERTCPLDSYFASFLEIVYRKCDRCVLGNVDYVNNSCVKLLCICLGFTPGLIIK